MNSGDSKLKSKKTMPKGGRKGGAVFPRIALDDALAYAKKLVSKTHVGPQQADIIHSGVVGAKSGTGNVRISALKQYGFLTGDTKKGFSASDLAKKIASSPPDELPPFHQIAALKPTVFKAIFDAFHGDTVSRGKLKQRASDLKVHPDETEACIETYVRSLELAKLLTVDGDQVKHMPAPTTSDETISAGPEDASEEEAAGNLLSDNTDDGAADSSKLDDADQMKEAAKPRAVFNVNVNLDSSLDIEKLAKQLELLKRFGAI